jgi:ABC-type multidrug transport system fused ATPase/permease subunit
MDVVIIFTALTLILTSHNMTGATAGFILAFAGTITAQVNWLLIELRQIEVQGVSLERTADYRALELEEGEELNVNDQAAQEALQADIYREYDGWPSKGEIKVGELSASYGPSLPDILHEVSFDVPGGQSVGIVGATGGGKSTLAKAFFSFVDITHGKIEIDGESGSDSAFVECIDEAVLFAREDSADRCFTRYRQCASRSGPLQTRHHRPRSYPAVGDAQAQSRHRGQVLR